MGVDDEDDDDEDHDDSDEKGEANVGAETGILRWEDGEKGKRGRR